MPSTTPIPVSILANVKTALEAVTVAAGYRTTVATVDTQFINPETLGAGSKIPALAVFSDEIDFEIVGIGSTPTQAGQFRLKVQGILRADTTPNTKIHNFVQDVREKLLADRGRGSNANNTHITRVELAGESLGKFGSAPFYAKPFVGFLMDVVVDYQENL